MSSGPDWRGPLRVQVIFPTSCFNSIVSFALLPTDQFDVPCSGNIGRRVRGEL